MTWLSLAATEALPPPEAIHAEAERILRQPEFHPDPAPLYAPWAEMVRRILGRAFHAVAPLFEGLFGISPLLYWVAVVGLAIAAVGLVFHLGNAIRHAFGGAASKGGRFVNGVVFSESPEGWEKQAWRAGADGDAIGAVRLLFKACLLRLDTARGKAMRKGATNRECLQAFRGTAAHDCLAVFVETIDHKWYAGQVCSLDDFEKCRSAHEAVCRAAKEMSSARGA